MQVLTSLLALALSAAAQSSVSVPPARVTHVITVRNNLTADDATMVFTPQMVNASLEETVLFNFTEGTHSVTQSTFAKPCLPAHEANVSINGLDSGLINGTAKNPGQFIIIMHADIIGQPFWFYDQKTCGAGGVGVINVGNASATLQPLDAFVRNAMRLNGTQASASSSATSPSSSGGSSSGSSGSPSSGGSSSGNGGDNGNGNNGGGSTNGTKGSAAAPGPSPSSFASVTAITLIAVLTAAVALVA